LLVSISGGAMTLAAVLAITLTAAPISLNEALALAARRNPALEMARSDVLAAGANVQQSYSGVLPRLDVSAEAGVERTQESGVGSTSKDNQFQVALAQPLVNVPSWNLISAQRTRDAAAQQQFEETRLQVAFNVTRAFYEVVKQQHGLEVRKATAELSKELVGRADALFAAGRGSKADAYSARANLENDRIAVEGQAAVLETALSDLAVAIGLDSDVGLDVVAPFPVAGPELPALDEPPPLPGLLAQARKDRPLVHALRLAGEAAQTDVAVAQAAYWPLVGLSGSVSRVQTIVPGSSGLSSTQYYALVGQVTLTWNLYAGGSTAASASLARATASRAEASLAAGQQTVASEVEVARAQVSTLARSAAAVRPLMEASENALKFARELLDLGRSSQLEVRDAALKVEQARLVWVNTAADLIVARANLTRAVSGVAPREPASEGAQR
jgi:outer membrane protein